MAAPQNLNPAVVPTWIFTPTPNAAATLRIVNNGGYTVYIGGSNVSPFNGFPVPPYCRPVEIQNVNISGSLYACSQVYTTATSTTLTATAIPAGATSFTVTSTALTAATLPAALVLGNGTGQEVVSMTALTSNTIASLSTKTLYDHAASATVSTATVWPSNISVFAGVV